MLIIPMYEFVIVDALLSERVQDERKSSEKFFLLKF